MLSPKPWRPEEVLQLMALLFASMFIGVFLIGLVNAVSWLGAVTQQVLSLAIGTLSFHGVALLLTHQFLRRHEITWEQAFGFRTARLARTLGLALLVAVAVLPITGSLGYLSAKAMTALHLEPVVQAPVKMLQSGTSLATQAAIGFLAIVLAPFAEEVVFRGLIYPSLKQAGFPHLALWGTSFIFAAIHTNLMILLPLTFLAVVLTLFYESSDNLLGPVVAHGIFNFVNFFWVLTQPVSWVSLNRS